MPQMNWCQHQAQIIEINLLRLSDKVGNNNCNDISLIQSNYLACVFVYVDVSGFIFFFLFVRRFARLVIQFKSRP